MRVAIYTFFEEIHTKESSVSSAENATWKIARQFFMEEPAQVLFFSDRDNDVRRKTLLKSRPAGKNLLRDIDSGLIDIVLCRDPIEFGRSMFEGMKFASDLTSRGTVVAFVSFLESHSEAWKENLMIPRDMDTLIKVSTIIGEHADFRIKEYSERSKKAKNKNS